MKVLTLCFVVWATIGVSKGVSTRMDFAEEDTAIVTNSTNDDEDVEVKHTIVVSTKLKDSRKGFRNSNNGDTGTTTYNIGNRNTKGEDTDEVPIINGYKSVETTAIRTPDTRRKANIYPDAYFVSRNIRDEYDNVYPNVAANPMQWKPSKFYNNIHYYTPDNVDYNEARKTRPQVQNPKLHRKITDEGMREFYCKKCSEFNGRAYRGCSSTFVQQRSANPWQYETTTPKLKLDGKLAKLN